MGTSGEVVGLKTVEDVPAWLEKIVKKYKGAWPLEEKSYMRVYNNLGQVKLEKPEFDFASSLIFGDSATYEDRQSDPVNHPAHYTQGGIECIDAIQASMSHDEFSGYLKGNCQKYIWRYRQKGGAQDLAKARWYLERLESHASGL